MSKVGDSALPLHRLHDEDVERLLATGERRTELTALFGQEGYGELSELARQAERAPLRGGPPVYILPGLMGSRIGSRGRLIDDVLWLDLIEVAAGHLTRLALPRGDKLTALGVMLLNSLKIKLSLKIAGFDTRFHAYDWRRSVKILAAELNARIRRDRSSKVMVVGHSMGGLVARLALAGDRGRIARVVQVGSPNHGSFAPVLAMRGVYPSVRKLAALDQRHSAEDLARVIFRTLPALHELLPDPSRAAGPNLFDLGSWPEDDLQPDRRLLAAASTARRSWPESDSRCLHIIGSGQETVTRLQKRNGSFEYSLTHEGDGTVPLALAEMSGVPAWFANEKHGGLPNNGRVISAVADLLRDGVTDRLPGSARRSRRPARRTLSEAAMRRIAPNKVNLQDLSPDARRRLLEPVVSPEFHGGVPADALRQPPRAAGPGGRRRIEIRLCHGSIVDANARALAVGVFRNVDPSGAAAAVDARLDGAIAEFNLRRMFLGSLGQVFIMPATRTPLLADFVLLTGLGDFDDFGPDAQRFVAENVVRTLARARAEDFATVLIGAGSGVPVAETVERQLAGFLEGLRHGDPGRIIRRITFCEVNARKYRALRTVVQRMAVSLAGEDFELVVDESDVVGSGERPIPSSRPRRRADPAYLLVTMPRIGRSSYDCRSAVLTAGAKAAVLSGSVRVSRRELAAALEPIESLSAQQLGRLGAGLANLLLPEAVRKGLAAMSSRPLVLVHDFEASRIPWETLAIDGDHPAVKRGISRRFASENLSVARWQEDRLAGDKTRVLMVVDPTGDLPGAAAEGDSLLQTLQRAGADVELLKGARATRERLLQMLGTGEHDILHFAGHATFNRSAPESSGLLCAGGKILRGVDLDRVATLPALVFFNACEAARLRATPARAGSQLSRLHCSTSIAEAFLSGGVANFLGTHWPVNDADAAAFAQSLYGSLLRGTPLGMAILKARRLIMAKGSPDWADYVHYGNPAFVLARRK